VALVGGGVSVEFTLPLPHAAIHKHAPGARQAATSHPEIFIIDVPADGNLYSFSLLIVTPILPLVR